MSHKIYDYDPDNIDPEILQAIGLVIASSAQTEHTVEMAIAGCLGVDGEYGYAVTTHIGAPLRDSILRSVAEIRIDDLDLLDELDSLLDRVNKAFEKRNAIAHNSLCRDPETDNTFFVRYRSRRRLEADMLPITAAEIKADATLIKQAGLDLISFLSANKLFPALPDQARVRGHKSPAARKLRKQQHEKKG